METKDNIPFWADLGGAQKSALDEALFEYLKDYTPAVRPFREKAFRKAWDAWEQTGPLEKVLCVAVMNGWAKGKQRELDRKGQTQP